MNNPYINLIRAVWSYGKTWRMTIVGYYIAFIIAQSALSFSPYAFGRAIDVLQNFNADRLHDLIFWLAIGILVLLIFWLFHGPGRVVERHVALKIQQKFRLNFYEALTRLPLKWHQDHHSGDIITRANRAATSLGRFAGDQYIYIQTIVKFIASIGFLLWISLPVGLLSVLFSFSILATVLLFDRKLIPLYDGENEVENRVGAVLFDYISNMTTILTLRLGELTHNNLMQRLLAIWPIFRQEAVWNEAKWFSINVLLNLVQTLILIGYIIHSLNVSGTIMIGLVVMMFRYQWELSAVFYELSNQYGEIVHMNTDVDGIKPIEADMAKYAHLPQGAATAVQWHTIDVKHLSFQHTAEETRGHIFKDIQFQIHRGEKIALIGKSGSGKSTLLNLLSGLYLPSEIDLCIDNIAFSSLEPLQAITTLIPQDPEIFENTIEFNITLDLPTNAATIQQAVNLAGFTEVLAQLPKGLQTDIREKGLNLSVGQKQRLALARGLFAARFSSLILMDEPTSSVDLPTEKNILSGVIEAFPDAALMVSLHRLHLLPKFDKVIMLSDGEVIASGKVGELLQNPGPVRDLYQAYLQEQ